MKPCQHLDAFSETSRATADGFRILHCDECGADFPAPYLAAPQPNPRTVWSAFILNDNGTWRQPSFSAPSAMTAEDVEFELGRRLQRGEFYITGIDRDPEGEPQFDITPEEWTIR